MSIESTVELQGTLVTETGDAYGVKFEDDFFDREAPVVWLPKSQVTMEDEGTFIIPEWLAVEKGLV